MDERQPSLISKIASELISECGAITSATLVQAHIVARRQSVPFGRALVMSGNLGEGDLTSLLQAAQMVKDNQLGKHAAVSLLKKSFNECVPFVDIARNWLKGTTSKLGELLLDAKLCSREQLLNLQSQEKASGLTLGRLAVLSDILTNAQLKACIEALALVRGRCISSELAARAVKIVVDWDSTFMQALQSMGISLPPVAPRVGELLYEASVLTEQDVLIAAEIGIETDVPIGEILFKQGLVPPVVLKAALRLQSMVMSGRLTQPQAQELLKQANACKVPVEKVLEELGQLKKHVIDFLKQANLVTEKDLMRAREHFPGLQDDEAKALLLSRAIDPQIFKAAVRCLDMINAKKVSSDQAILALHYSRRTGSPIEQALVELKWPAGKADTTLKLNLGALDERLTERFGAERLNAVCA